MRSAASHVYSGMCTYNRSSLIFGLGDDRREEPRIAIAKSVSLISGASAPPKHGKLVNLSRGGALVLPPDEPYGIGTMLRLSVKLAEHREFKLAAIVRTCLHQQANGLLFMGLTPGDRCWLDNLVRQCQKAGLAGNDAPSHMIPDRELNPQAVRGSRPTIYQPDGTWLPQPTIQRRLAA